MKDALLHAIGVALDGLDVGFCAFDSQDRTLAWNATFLALFPEHDGFVHAGESYQANLRRFYNSRLGPEELPHIERYVAEGVARHRAQRRPYEFDHRDGRVRVSSFEMGRFGRVRVWRKVANLPTVVTEPPSSTRRLAELNATAVLERQVHGVVIVNVSDRVMWANKAFLELYGLRSLDAALGRSFNDVYRAAWAGNEDSALFQESMLTLLENQRFSGAPFELRLPDDRFARVVEQRGEADGRGYFEHVDVTSMRRQQTALARAERQYRLLAEHSSDIILSVEDGVTTYASPALNELLGWESAEVLGRPIVQFIHPDDVESVAQVLSSPEARRGQVDYQARALHRNGTYVWVEARARHVPGNREGLALARVINLRGIDARKAVEDKLERAQALLTELVATDPLTGLANRRKLNEIFPSEARRAQRDGLPLSVLVGDIDHFKQVNDTFGHHVGDQVLVTVGSVIASFAQRAGDLACRLGGEEFVLVLPATDADAAMAVARNLRGAVEADDFQAPKLKVTLSIGVATLAPKSPDTNADQLLQAADAALYEAKRNGRNSVVASGGLPQTARVDGGSSQS